MIKMGYLWSVIKGSAKLFRCRLKRIRECELQYKDRVELRFRDNDTRKAWQGMPIITEYQTTNNVLCNRTSLLLAVCCYNHVLGSCPAPFFCILSPVLYTLHMNDCKPLKQGHHYYIKYGEDTAIIGFLNCRPLSFSDFSLLYSLHLLL